MKDEHMNITVAGAAPAQAVAQQLYQTPNVHGVLVLPLASDSYYISWYLRTAE